MKRRAIDGDESDVVSRTWRRMMRLKSVRSGATSAVKRRMRRRERHEGRHALQKEGAS